MFFARPARLDSVGRLERGKMSHEAECLAMAVRPVGACASNICNEKQIATPSARSAWLPPPRKRYQSWRFAGLDVANALSLEPQPPLYVQELRAIADGS